MKKAVVAILKSPDITSQDSNETNSYISCSLYFPMYELVYKNYLKINNLQLSFEIWIDH